MGDDTFYDWFARPLSVVFWVLVLLIGRLLLWVAFRLFEGAVNLWFDET